ncbi:MAG: hypothetical protein SGJ19_22680 [Planctomycetia bacterium]|nr:hypothetical protein [Planctomycetia bacterium]
MEAWRCIFGAWSLLTACCMAVGCRTTPTPQGLLERQSVDARLSSRQLRVMVNEFTVHFVDRIEVSADQLLANTSDPAIRRNALLWKINGTSACFQAASRPDPLAAYLDVWILNRQMTLYFESATGRQLFGPGQSLVLEECQSLERRLLSIDRAVGGELRFGKEFVTKFATDYPVRSLYFDREPIASRYIEEVQEPAKELMHVVGNLDESVTELKQLGTVYAKHLPKQARWEAELFLINSSQLEIVQRPLQDLSLTVAAVSRLAQVSEAIPALLERERRAFHEILANERQQTLSELDRMREATLVKFEQDTSVVLQALDEQRVAVGRDLHNETTTMLDAADEITRRRTEEAIQQTPDLIDHFFWRACQVFVVLMLLAAPAVWLVRRLKPASGQRSITPKLNEVADKPISLYGEDVLEDAA